MLSGALTTPGVQPPGQDNPDPAQEAAAAELAERIRQAQTAGTGSAARASRAGGDDMYARQRVAQLDAEVRNRRMSLEAAEKRREEYINVELKRLADQIGVSSERFRAAWDLAVFYRDKFDWDFRVAVHQAVVEAIEEDENARREIVRVLHALFTKMHDAMLGTRVSASGLFDPKRYLRLPEKPLDDSHHERFAQAGAQQRELDVQAAELARRQNDPYYDKKVDEERQELAKAKADLARAKTST